MDAKTAPQGVTIARKFADSVFTVLLTKGGVAPRMRLRKAGSLSQLEREEISRNIVAGFRYCSIGKLLGRAASTISREVARNGSRKTYRALRADSNALQRGLRPKRPAYIPGRH